MALFCKQVWDMFSLSASFRNTNLLGNLVDAHTGRSFGAKRNFIFCFIHDGKILRRL